ncbi:metallophosphoesterase, partial [Clostridium sp.]|uniref:metallophosphoesterase n=1 Tax=Clostridium sp. TaxID=1506 RepID=UPI00346410FA
MSSPKTEESSEKKEEEQEENILSFSVLGDVHAETEKLDRVIKDLHNIDPNMDALFLNGDVVGQGLEEQYNDVNKTLEKNKKILPKHVIKNIGNHEFFDYTIKHNSPSHVDEFLKRYYNFSGETKPYHSRWIEGYNFISLGSESSNTKEMGSLNAYISDTQKAWLKEKLAEDYKPGRPIFVFLHQNLFWNAHPWVDTYKKKEIIDTLSKYPEVILFYSHNHASLKSRTVYE